MALSWPIHFERDRESGMSSSGSTDGGTEKTMEREFLFESRTPINYLSILSSFRTTWHPPPVQLLQGIINIEKLLGIFCLVHYEIFKRPKGKLETG